ncbi:MAG: hypothetical protein RSE00_02445 [Clostridia bacterium]
MLTNSKIFNYITFTLALSTVISAVYTSKSHASPFIAIALLISTVVFYGISNKVNAKNISTKKNKKEDDLKLEKLKEKLENIKQEQKESNIK